MDLTKLFGELKRRNVIRVAGLYLVGAWLLTQVASTLLPAFDAPSWALRGLIVTLAITFIPAVIFSWVFELTPQGLKREDDVAPEQSITPQTGRRMDRTIIAVLVLALGYFAFDKFVLTPRREAALVSNAAPNESKSVVDAKSIAVLPFENLSSDKENAYFTDGVQDEILTDLAKIADLKVISRTSVMQYKSGIARNLRKIGEELGVARVLEGSVQRAGNKVRVNAQLIDARNDTHLWAQTYDRDLADVFAIQSEVAKAIAEQLQARISPKEQESIQTKPTSNLVAYDLYLRATDIWRSLSTSSGNGGVDKVKQAIRLLDQAIEQDPSFVPALCFLVRAHMYLHWQVPDPAARHVELSNQALESAARLQPDSGDVHLTRAQFYYYASRNYPAALQELSTARQGLPNSAEIPYTSGVIERRQGKWEESTRHIEEALQLDPRNVQYISELCGTNYYLTRRYADAVRVLDGALSWRPNDFGLAFTRAFICIAWKADLSPWREVVSGEIAKNADPNDLMTARLNLALKQRDYHAAGEILESPGGNEFDDDGFFTPREFNQGVVARSLGQATKAHASFQAARDRAVAAVRQRPDDAKALVCLAEIDAALGRKDDAIGEGEHAAELLPITKDALNGAELSMKLAGIYAQVGEVDRAVGLLEELVKKPGVAHYGLLKLDEVWDPLRRDARFEKIVADLAPK
jgi:TolB-like protein/Flp pilus assembly protein TadD